MQLSVALLRVNPVEVRDQQTQQEGENLRPRCSSCHGFSYFLPATTTTSLWSVLEDEDELEEVDEPSYAGRPLPPFLRPPLPPPELRPTAPVLDQSCSLGGALRHASTRCAVTPAATVVVATPTVAVPAVATVAASLFPSFSFCQLFLRGSAGPKDRVGILVVGYQQGLDEGKGRGGSCLSSIGRTIHASPGRFH